MDCICSILKDTITHDWRIRVEALQSLSALSVDWVKDPTLCRVAVPCLIKQIGDGRSLVMQQACEAARAASMNAGNAPGFEYHADAYLKACLPIVASSTKVMCEAAAFTLDVVVMANLKGSQVVLERLTQNAVGVGKSAAIRVKCVKLLERVMGGWERGDVLGRLGNAGMVEGALRKALGDADKDVRSAARAAFRAFYGVFPEEARRALREMNPDERNHFVDLLSPLSGNLTVARIAAPIPTIASLTPQHSSIKSASARPPPPSTAKKTTTFALGTTGQTAARKPFQAMALNVNAPPSAVKKLPLMAKTPSSVRRPAVSNVAPDSAICLVRSQTRDQLCRALVDCLGNDKSPASRLRRAEAMKKSAAIFVSEEVEDLLMSDFKTALDAIETCLWSEYAEVVAGAMDAFGTLMLALVERNNRDADVVSREAIQSLFPAILKRTKLQDDDAVVARAANRAVDACVEMFPHAVLLSSVVAYEKRCEDDSVLTCLVSRMRRANLSQAGSVAVA